MDSLSTQPFIIVLLVAISVTLWIKYQKQIEKVEKMAKDVIKIALLWEQKTSESNDDNKKLNEEIKNLLIEIKSLLSK